MAAVIFVLLTLCLTVTFGFNVDTSAKSRIIHKSLKDTMFGYDVDMLMTDVEYGLLVGAPRAQTNQPGVRKGGAVFRCSTSTARCNEAVFDQRGDTESDRLNGSTLLIEDSKSDQWFGATVSSSRKADDDSVVACAPRYLYFGADFKIKEPVGNCFHAKNDFRDIREFSPCKNKDKHGYHRLGYCMAGFSAAVGSSDQAFVGAPGAYYWGGSIISQPLEPFEKATFTKEGPKELDDQLLGYSTATGDFNGDQVDDVAVGVPRGANLSGMVALFDNNLRNLLNITGDQIASYFGASVAVTDVNDDGLDDIIVGAPLFTKLEQSSSGLKSTYEIGKIYVYYQSKQHLFDKSVSVLGQREWSKFGFDVAAVGDLNNDGFNDFIVGAPYDGVDRRNGAVYVFNGGKNGIREKFSQVIYGQSVQQNIETFGFSVAGGKDVDKNGYPDIIVGAYKSNTAVLFKTRPVVNIDGNIKLSKNVINLEDKSCRVVDQQSTTKSVACTMVETCVTYSGKGVPDELILRMQIILDAKQPGDPRARFLENNRFSKLTIEPDLSKGYQFCERQSIFVEEGIRDKLSPIVIHVNYSLIEDRFRNEPLVPVVDGINDGHLSTELKIWKDCGSDDVCIPDLQLSQPTLSKSKIAVGADDKFNLTVTVKNRLENAYEAQIYIYTPKGMDFQNAVDNKGRPVVCHKQQKSNEYANYELSKCELGNPMAGRSASTVVIAQYGTKSYEGPYDKVSIYVKANSTNNETTNTMADNFKTVTMTFSLDANLTVYGASINDSYIYDVEGYKDPKNFQWDDDIGPLVTHTYDVLNSGTTTLSEVVIDIYFPSHTYDNQNLLYVIDDIHLSDNYHNTQCEMIGGVVNPIHVAINKNRERRQIPPGDAERLRTPGQRVSAFGKLVDELKGVTDFPSLRSRIAQLENTDCREMNCTQWRCVTTDMKADFRLILSIDSRLWTNSLIKEGFYGASISSVIIVKVTKLPYKAPSGIDLPFKHYVVTTTVTPSDPSRARREFPIWLIIVAVLAGLALLILLILLLWRCGFFKRKRPPRGQALLAKPTESEYYGYSTYHPSSPNYPTHGQPYGEKL